VIVVDASIALAWVLPDTDQNQRHAATVAELGVSGTEELVAPRLLVTECSYRLLKYGWAHRWGEAKIAESAELIDLLNLRYFEITSPVASLVRFAVRHHVQWDTTPCTLGWHCVWALGLQPSMADFARPPRRLA
jgi:predicted nucleic acid-binding protein